MDQQERRLAPAARQRDDADARAGAIAIALAKGCTYAQIGADLGVSRQRVHQIARTDLIDLNQVIERGRWSRSQDHLRRIEAAIAAPTSPCLSEVAKIAGIQPASVEALLTPAQRSELAARRTEADAARGRARRGARVSDHDALDALRAAQRAHGAASLTMKAYESHRAGSGEPDRMLTPISLAARFGSWNAALAAAGLAAPHQRAATSRVWDQAACRAHLVEAAASLGAGASWTAYERAARRAGPSAPSAATVRSRLGVAVVDQVLTDARAGARAAQTQGAS